MARRRAPGRSARGAARSAAPRRRRRLDSYDLAELAGGLAVGYGLAVNGNQTASGSNSIVGAMRALDPSKIPAAVRSTITELKAPGSMTRNAVLGGAALYAAAKVAREVFPSLHRVKIKFGRRTIHLV